VNNPDTVHNFKSQ